MIGYKIAVVDDDERVLESLTNLLESHEYSVYAYVSARSFLAADDILTDVHCLITDVSMPGMDGFQLCKYLEVERPCLPVILITARPDVSDQVGSPQNKFGLLQKPFECKELLDALADAVAQAPY